MQKLPRRTVLLRGAQLVSALSVLPLLVSRAQAAELACVDHASESLREGLNYVDPAKNAAQQCGGCGFFTAKGACGECTIMSGPVSATAHCDSWAAKG